jgi:hypothetical protein
MHIISNRAHTHTHTQTQTQTQPHRSAYIGVYLLTQGRNPRISAPWGRCSSRSLAVFARRTRPALTHTHTCQIHYKLNVCVLCESVMIYVCMCVRVHTHTHHTYTCSKSQRADDPPSTAQTYPSPIYCAASGPSLIHYTYNMCAVCERVDTRS